MDIPRGFANVVLDIPAPDLRDKVFSYAIPLDLAENTFAGAQVLVPFGAMGEATGYVVSLASQPPQGITPKPILEVLDAEPLFDPEYVSFLTNVANYYGASLAEVVSAAVPAFLTPKIKRRIRFCSTSKEQPDEKQLAEWDGDVKAVFAILRDAKGSGLATLALRQRWRKVTRGSPTRFYRAVSFLKHANVIEGFTENDNVQVPKTVRTVVWTGTAAAEKRHQQIIQTLVDSGGQMSCAELIEAARTTNATLLRMAAHNLVQIKNGEQLRDPLAAFGVSEQKKPPALTDSQAIVWDALSAELTKTLALDPANAAEGSYRAKPWLLHGVTGSGKTEIYLRLIEATLAKGRSALLLVPEIALTPQLARRALERFGSNVAVWHSAVSAGERYDTWRRLRSGQARVLLGARSAVLANIPNLGLIILDEEHDASYKQSTPSPRYHAKDVAIEKASLTGALLLLGSATPDVSTYYTAHSEGRILSLPNRIFNQPLPTITVVDMRQEFLAGNRSIFSPTLLDRLRECHSKGEQAILLMNRRGYASHVFCRACGFVATCQHCSVALVYHQTTTKDKSSEAAGSVRSFLACHHCGYRCPTPHDCPACHRPFIKQYGLGTQRVEAELTSYFPEARILRLDSDVASQKDAHDRILTSFAGGEADFLIGTQMVAKGLDIERVTLVGILAADAAFNMPDYRSVERGFQLLTQVAGRAGRGSREGSVVLQTYNLEMPALAWAQTHDYASFYAAEIESRQAFDYPPFSQLLRVVVAAEDSETAERECEVIAEAVARHLEDDLPAPQIEILGPAPCLLERLRNKYRMHLLIKNRAGGIGRQALTAFFRRRKHSGDVFVALDVDALDLL